MHKNILAVLFFFSLCFAFQSYAQDGKMIERELNRLKLIIDRTSAFIEVLPENDVKQLLRNYLQNANEEYRQAVDFANKGRPLLARGHIVKAYQYLKNIESLIKDHPIFKIKFRERLDTKIQQAEEIVQAKQNVEAMHMLNRAKFFRQKAYLAIRSDQSYNALEYYRLALFFADKALRIANGEPDEVSNDRNLLSETEMLLERASQLVENSQSSQLKDMIDKANEEMREIRRLYANQQTETASGRLAVLHRSLYRIIDLAEDVPQREDERLKLDLETLKTVLQSLEMDIRGINSPAANRLYFRISNLVNNIERDIKEGNVVLARQKIFMANRLILNIYRLVESKSLISSKELGLQIDRAKQDFEELQNSADLSSSSELLNLIKVNLNNAVKANSENNLTQASFYLKMANQLILKLNRLRLLQSSDNVGIKSVEADLQRLEGLLNRIDLNKIDNGDFSVRYENSKKLYEIAKKAFSDNDIQLCHELTNMAINLITQ